MTPSDVSTDSLGIFQVDKAFVGFGIVHNLLAVLFHTFEVSPYGVFRHSVRFFLCCAIGHASGKSGHNDRITALRFRSKHYSVGKRCFHKKHYTTIMAALTMQNMIASYFIGRMLTKTYFLVTLR